MAIFGIDLLIIKHNTSHTMLPKLHRVHKKIKKPYRRGQYLRYNTKDLLNAVDCTILNKAIA